MFIAALLIAAKKQSQPGRPSMDNGHMVQMDEFYSDIRNKMMSFAEKCMEIEIPLSGMRQTLKDIFHIFSR